MQLDRVCSLPLQIVVASLILAPFFGYQEPLPEKGFYFYGIIFLIAGFFTILPMFLNVYALNKLSSSTAGIFIYLNPILSFLLAIFYFHEPMSQLKIWAYSIVSFSVILLNSALLYQLMLKPVREQMGNGGMKHEECLSGLTGKDGHHQLKRATLFLVLHGSHTNFAHLGRACDIILIPP